MSSGPGPGTGKDLFWHGAKKRKEDGERGGSYRVILE